jgi:hypothetical protein
MASIAWNSGAGSAFPRRGSHSIESAGGVQVAGVSVRGCGDAQGAILELRSRNQPRVADRHRDGDGSVLIDESGLILIRSNERHPHILTELGQISDRVGGKH